MNIYRDLIRRAAEMEQNKVYSGYYSMLQSYRRPDHICIFQWWRKRLADVFKGLFDLVKPTHSGLILWSILISMPFICIVDCANKKSNGYSIPLSIYEQRIVRIETMLDSVLSQVRPQNTGNTLVKEAKKKK